MVDELLEEEIIGTEIEDLEINRPKPTKSMNDWDLDYKKLVEEQIQVMQERMELDKHNLMEELNTIDVCHRYAPTSGCVKGSNIKKFSGVSL